jgi:ATP-dependent DNA helicase RecQ
MGTASGKELDDASVNGPDVLLGHLRTMLGPREGFRESQRQAIEAILVPGTRALVVQRTGWGKSLVYWISTRVIRDAGGGPTLIVSPLLSLMRNQIEMAEKLGLRAVTINSSNRDDWAEVVEEMRLRTVDVVLISPERLANEEFIGTALPAMGSIGLFVVDEAHCISDWGHDFRPDYRRLARILSSLPPTLSVLATTATANDRVVEDVASQLGAPVEILRGPLARDSLSLHVVPLADQAERLAWLASELPNLPGSGIVYCLTVADTFRVAAWLNLQGIVALPYNASVEPDARLRAEQSLLGNTVKALVATTALGMGFDKPDLGFVVHYQRPGSAVAYYQQVGRAGRAVDHAVAVLLTGREDDEIAEYFIAEAFPPVEDLRAVLDAVAACTEASVPLLETRLNVSRGQIQKALKLLEIDAAVGHEHGRFFRTANPWEPDVARIERVTAIRRRELDQMRAYITHPGCLMEFLVRALDDAAPARCGHCANDGSAAVSARAPHDLTLAATTFLRRDDRPIEPRRRWAPGAVAALTGSIEPANLPGRALSIYGDAGWGRLVRQGKYVDGVFDPTLVSAAAEMIRDRWRPDPAPTWVTAIPSASRPALVSDFASALADALGLPYREVLAARAGRSQKSMENSVQQLRNAQAKIALVGAVPSEPVLLVDDLVDSRWTLTYAGWLLTSAGAPAVHPFALASGSRGDE